MEVTTYKTSDGEIVLISDLNAFHLVNALLKVSRFVDTFAPDRGDGEELVGAMHTQHALKAEVLKRLLPPKTE